MASCVTKRKQPPRATRATRSSVAAALAVALAVELVVAALAPAVAADC